MPTTSSITDAITALGQLTSEQLLGRLAELHTEEQQIRVLLRAARARERAARTVGPKQEGSRHA